MVSFIYIFFLQIDFMAVYKNCFCKEKIVNAGCLAGH